MGHHALDDSETRQTADCDEQMLGQYMKCEVLLERSGTRTAMPRQNTE